MMTESRFSVPEDPMEAEPATGLGSSVLDMHICPQHPETPSPRLTGTKTLSVWKHLERKETGRYLKSREVTILHEKEEEKRRSARKTIQESLPNKSTTKMDLFQHDIFYNQKVHVGNVCHLRRHLVAETRSPAIISAVPKEEVKSGEKKVRPTGHSNVGIHLPKVDLGKAEREMKEETEQGQQELEKREEEIRNDAQEDMCTPPLQDKEAEQAEEHPQELQNLRQTWQSIIQTEDLEFEDIADLAGETMELGEARKDKSAGRRFLNWLDERKNARTYRRELEEGDQLYRTSYMARPMTRAQREQRKWQKHSAEKLPDAHWEMQRHVKEVLRLKEKERHEGWAAGHGLSVPDSSPEQPKKRMSKWEKRFLGVKESFSC